MITARDERLRSAREEHLKAKAAPAAAEPQLRLHCARVGGRSACCEPRLTKRGS